MLSNCSHSRVDISCGLCINDKKKQGLYEAIIDHVNSWAEKTCGQKLNPEFIMSDFEIAILSAMSTRFPSSRVRGCWFHFCQV